MTPSTLTSQPPPRLADTAASVLHFGPFTLDLAAAQLRRDGQPVAMRPKAFELLVALASRPGTLVSKDELLDTVWGRRFITEGVIKTVVGELRTALGDDPKQPRWIETVPRRGYRFAAGAHRHGAAAEAGAALQTSDSTASHVATHAATPAATPVAATPFNSGPAAGNLPAALAPTLGRTLELAALAALAGQHRVLTVAGPSGIGKTRLALALAAAQRTAWPDGVWFVELAPLAAETTDAATLRALLAQALKLGGASASSTAALAGALQPLALLLVLDNAEHLLDTLAPLLTQLLSQAPQLHIVLTSQEPLRIPGEQVFRLAPLAVPLATDDGDAGKLMASGAVQLFVARVAGSLPGFALAPQQQQAVAEICRALDGLPLALELAAARVPLLGVHGIAALLLGHDDDPRLQLLTQGARTAHTRQRTLRDALQWSHDLLDDRQRRVFRRLGVFRGGFTLAAAQAVCGDSTLDEWAVLDAVQALVEKSLVTAPAQPGATPRFKLLESLRSFALERLADAGETDATRRRHLCAACSYWTRADLRGLSDPVLAWVTEHGPEIDNLRAALRYASSTPATRPNANPSPQGTVSEPAPGRAADDALALFVVSSVLWCRADIAAEGRIWCEALRAQAERTDNPALRHGFDLSVAILSLYAGAYPPAEGAAAAARAADGFDGAGDRVRGYYALNLCYQLNLRAARPGPNASVLARMQLLEQPDWGVLLTRYRRVVTGYEHRLAGRSDDYLAYCRNELALCRQHGAVSEGWNAAQGLMLAEQDIGDTAAALAVGEQALAEVRAAGRMRQHAAMLALWTTMLAESGDCNGARRALAEALPALRSVGTPWMAHLALAWLAHQEHRDVAAAQLIGWQEAEQRSRSGNPPGQYIARSLQALCVRLAQRLGDAGLASARRTGEALDHDSAERLALAD